MFAHFSFRLGPQQLQFWCIYVHTTYKVSTCALGSWRLVLGLLLWIRVQGRRTPYNNLVSSAPEVNEFEEELEKNNLVFPSNKKEVAMLRDKGKNRKVVAYASFQLPTHFFTKASFQRNTI